MKSYGQVVREFRLHKKLTLEELAKRTGTVKGYLSGVENGKVNPPATAVTKRLARALGLSAPALLVLAHCEKAPSEIREWLRENVNPHISPVIGE